MNPWASSMVWRKLVSVLSTEVRILSISLVFMSRASSAVPDGVCLNLSRALVMAPVNPALDLLTAARSAGGLLLVDMAL